MDGRGKGEFKAGQRQGNVKFHCFPEQYCIPGVSSGTERTPLYSEEIEEVQAASSRRRRRRRRPKHIVLTIVKTRYTTIVVSLFGCCSNAVPATASIALLPQFRD